MIRIVSRATTSRLKIRRSMARLFQAYCYRYLPSEEHAGYPHPNGKRFKSTNFRIRYLDDRFAIDFTALNEADEQTLATALLREGLSLGDVHFAETTVSLEKREIPDGTLTVRGFVCAAIKNPLTRRKIFLEPGESRHTEIITNHALQKYETLYGKPYEGTFRITTLWQSPKPQTFWYEKTPYTAWEARYEIEADESMKRLLLTTGMGSDTMKNLGFLEVV